MKSLPPDGGTPSRIENALGFPNPASLNPPTFRKNPPTFRSWEVSIRNCVREIQRENKRRKTGGYYLTPEELLETLEEAYLNAIDEASLEVEEGRYDLAQLEQLVNCLEILNQAMVLILPQE